MKIISFLGTGNYEEIVYCRGDHRHSTRLFQAALCKLLHPEELIIVVTHSARTKWLAELEAEIHQLGLSVKVSPVDIPDGKSPDELWQIFASVTATLAQGDEVVFDITHSFRSIPMLAFLATAYLRATADVTVRAVYYGAYDAKNDDGEAPVFDLTPFVDLLAWTTASESYLRSGDARSLADMVAAIDRQGRKHASIAGRPLAERLAALATPFARLSSALILARPREVLPTAHLLISRLPEAEEEVRRLAPPLALLLNKIRADLEIIACADTDLSTAGLAAQRRLIEWYVTKRMWMQAATLAREWVVSLLCFSCGLDWITGRDQMEAALCGNAVMKQGGVSRAPVNVAAALTALDPDNEITREWNSISDLRNDINHAGMRKEKTEISKLAKRVERLPVSLHRIGEICGIGE